ncbi:hypothetical protein [Sphingomonas sp. Marseille-Q8236]
MTDVKVEQCDINEAEEFRDILDSADAEYPSYAINVLAEILARHRQAAEKAQQERDAGIAENYPSNEWHVIPIVRGIATAIRSQGHE